MISFREKATLELLLARKCDTILSLPLKTFCGFRVRTKRRKKNKHIMKFKPYQEQKIWAEKPQSSIFMGNFQFYQDRLGKRAGIAMLCGTDVKLSFYFLLILDFSYFISVYVYINYLLSNPDMKHLRINT